MSEYILFFFAWFVAAVINNIAGFGAALMAMPLVAYAIPLDIAVPSSTLLVLALSCQMGWSYRKHIQKAALQYICIGGIAGVAVGISVLQSVGNESLKLAMGLLLIAYALFSICWPAGLRKAHAINPRWGIVAGFASTVLGALFGFNGPPLAVFVSLTGWPKETVKGVLGVCFLLTGTLILTGQLIAGIHSLQTVTYFAVGCPAVLLGGGVGILLSRFIGQVAYQRILLILILVAGTSVAWSAI
ncbi:sulfite exporter TauE/SafE family protein [Pseudodesulfovibrio tunisiensis]|uniref:sulfite exporter TauE/SafE family protein n=1 Tax=Pseudodesulfovibrio tunisiensis TaxID=463192 RepID=UPI001FB4C162|nr:sulfite exporter TauE/SafE family protein [Pseudodesulfovibrio tunisiensis]